LYLRGGCGGARGSIAAGVHRIIRVVVGGVLRNQDPHLLTLRIKQLAHLSLLLLLLFLL